MYNREYTPERITELRPNEIFVFGSNLAGAHGGGAARLAYERFGAIWGHGVGLQGQSYAIPTMQGGVETIKPYVDEFIRFAQTRPNLKLYVTQIGCGIAGFKVEDIAPLFAKAYYIKNVFLPKDFVEVLRKVIRLPETWSCEFIFDAEDVTLMKSLSTARERIEYRNGLIQRNKFKLSNAWANMPCGKFVKNGNTLVGFEPANDNIKRNLNLAGLGEGSFSVVSASLTLEHLIFPGEEILNIADEMFDSIEVLDKIELPWELERIGQKGGKGVFRNCILRELEIPADVTFLGDYVFSKCQIESLTIHPATLRGEYGRQFKGSSINILYLPESSLPLSSSEFGILRSIVANASVKEVCLENDVHMSWDDFRQLI